MKQFFTYPGDKWPATLALKQPIYVWFLFLLCCPGMAFSQNIIPVVNTYSPQCTFAQEAFVLTINGQDFRTDIANNRVQVELTTTTGTITFPQVLSATPSQLTVNIPASAQPGQGTLTFRVRNQVGNSSNYNYSVSNTITVYPLPSQISGSQSVCTGSTSTYTISNPAGNSYTYRWAILNGNASISGPNTGTSVQVAFGPGSGNVTIGAYATSSCGNEMREPRTLVVVVNPLPDILSISGPTIICSGETVQLDVNAISNIPAPNNGLTYSWTRNGQPIGNFPSIIVQQNGERILTPLDGNYEVTVTNSAGCQRSATKSLTGSTTPSPPSTTSASRCGPGSVTLSASGGTAGQYRWFTQASGGTPIAGANGPSYTTPNLTSTTSYWVALQNAQGCISARTQVTATINFQPEVSITGVTALCEGNSTNLTANVTNDPGGISYTYQWYQDNVLLTGETNATLAVSEEGIYRVEVATPAGCSASAEQTIQVNPLPTITVSSSNDNYCAGGSTVLTASGAQTYSWTPATGLSATSGASVSASPTVTTTYTVTGTDANGCVNTSQVTVNVRPVPTFTIQSSTGSNQYCPREEITLSVSNEAIPTATYSWSAPGNPNFATGTSVTLSPVGNVTYTVEALADGCTHTEQINMLQRNAPTASISGPNVICDGTAITLSGTGTVAAPLVINNYEWFLNDTTAAPIASGSTANTISVATAGTYYLRTFSNNGCSSIAASYEVTASTTPPTPTISGNLAFCTGSSTTLTASTISAGETYQWYQDGNLLSGQTNQTLTVTTAGTYSVEVDNAGCTSAQASVVVAENANPTITVTNPAPVCAPATVDLTAEGVASSNQAVEFSYWLNAGATQPLTNPDAVSASGTYYIKGFNTSTGCFSIVPVSVTIHPQPAQPTITSTAENVIYTGERTNVSLSATPAGGQFFLDGVAIGNQLVPCNLNPDAPNVLTYRVTNATTGCSNETSKTLDVRKSTYTMLIVAAPFTICRGQNTTYTAFVYRDAEIIYPYLEDPQSIRFENRTTTYNPAYDPYLPAGTKDIHKAFPARFFQPVVNLGPEGEQLAPSLFRYQWTKNDNTFIGNDRQITNQAGLSSTDYYAVYITENGNSLCDINLNQTLPGNPRQGFRSNPLFIAQPEGYEINVTAPSPICEGDAITFTAELGEGEFGNYWEDANVTLEWYLERGGTEYLIKTVNGVSETQDPTLTAAEIATALGNAGLTETNVLDGDQIFVRFDSDLSALLSDKCNDGEISNAFEMSVNSLSATAEEQSTTICSDGSATFSLNVTSTGPNAVNYEWFVNGVSSGTGQTLTLSGLTKGTYNITAQVSNGCEAIPLSVGTLNVREVALFALEGGGSYCELEEAAFPEISLSGSENGIQYSLFREGEADPVETQTGNGGTLFFNPQLTKTPGTYYVVGEYTDAPACQQQMNGSATISVEEAAVAPDDALESWYTEDANFWEVRLVNNYYAAMPELGGASPQYAWAMSADNGLSFFPVTDDDPSDPTRIRVVANTYTDARLTISPPPGDYCIENQILFANITSPLPVEMLYFRGNKEGNQVILNWATAAEENNLGFDVQVSNNGLDYRSLGFVPSTNGNTHETQTYSFIDTEENMFGTRYYRLEQQDTDGKTELFGPIAVFINDTPMIMASPNPFREAISLSIQAEEAQPVSFKLYNANGRLVDTFTFELIKGPNRKQLPINDALPAGLYYLSGEMEGYRQQIRLIKQ